MPSDENPRIALAPGIFFVSLGVLLLETSLTRLFSFTIWYHFAYLTISVALLGFGSAGSVLAAWPHLLNDPRRLLSRSCIAAAMGVILVLTVVGAVPLDPLAVLQERREFLNLVVYYAAVTVPFFGAGVAVAGTFAVAPERIARLYFWDLMGAGLACFLVVPLIWRVQTPLTVGLAAVAFGVAALCFAWPPRATTITAAVLVAAVAVAVASRSQFMPARTKWISAHLASGGEMIFTQWTPINRVDAIAWDEAKQNTSSAYRTMGISPKFDGMGMHFRMIGYDGDSCAVMYHMENHPGQLEFFRHHVLTTPYVVREKPSVLIIGVGGGTDILNAIANGARSIVGVELNPVTVRLGKQDYAEYNGNIFNRADVTMVAAEGRHYLRSHADRYDLIEINGVDTLSALSSGAYVLSESYLYTADAVGDFLDHLNPGGVFAMAVSDLDTPGMQPRHAFRLASNVRLALTRRGITDPARHVAVIANPGSVPLVHTLVKAEPFTPDEIGRLDAFVQREGLSFWQRPDRRLPHDAALIYWADDGERERFFDAQDLRLWPTTDESPFFFSFYKWTRLPARRHELDAARTLATGQIVLLMMLAQSIVFATILIVAPLFRLRGGGARHRLGYMVYFAALGLGFIFIEISFIQRFVLYLGYPTYALSVVLFGMLIFTGIGSFLSGRVRAAPEDVLPKLLGVLAAIVIAYLIALRPLFTLTLGTPFAERVAISIALLAPLGLVLGMFFPLGVSALAGLDRRLVPWAWATNGSATVVGTILAVIAAVTWDFRRVSIAAVLVYGVGVFAFVRARRSDMS